MLPAPHAGTGTPRTARMPRRGRAVGPASLRGSRSEPCGDRAPGRGASAPAFPWTFAWLAHAYGVAYVGHHGKGAWEVDDRAVDLPPAALAGPARIPAKPLPLCARHRHHCRDLRGVRATGGEGRGAVSGLRVRHKIYLRPLRRRSLPELVAEPGAFGPAPGNSGQGPRKRLSCGRLAAEDQKEPYPLGQSARRCRRRARACCPGGRQGREPRVQQVRRPVPRPLQWRQGPLRPGHSAVPARANTARANTKRAQ
jgi:hypothetical protein